MRECLTCIPNFPVLVRKLHTSKAFLQTFVIFKFYHFINIHKQEMRATLILKRMQFPHLPIPLDVTFQNVFFNRRDVF